MNKLLEAKIAIVGLGYVGLPLAVEFAKKYHVVGIDINKNRVSELRSGFDRTLEIEEVTLKNIVSKDNGNNNGLFLTSEFEDLAGCNIYIVTVPTPIDKNNRPNIDPLFRASQMIAKLLKQDDIVIYESTVYPGLTEEECVPILESLSGLKFNIDFFVGYSPERINPGDKIHTVSKIKKITSGSNEITAEKVDQLYSSIITAGTFKAASIKVAEAAKVIENSQRDINIAFVNELSKIFHLLNIDTNDVLAAASTKWNFLNFKPGLVGGHCIGVDPYYLAHKAQEVGYHPEIILAGRRMNDGMGKYVAVETVKILINKNIKIKDCKLLILGFTFKENCPDVRNSKVIDIYNELQSFGCIIDVYDNVADKSEVLREYHISLLESDKSPVFENYSAVVIAVNHQSFSHFNIDARADLAVVDVKGMLLKNKVDFRL
jgi:UDP-N-acetyl-D-galactosamine dehydrogenase